MKPSPRFIVCSLLLVLTAPCATHAADVTFESLPGAQTGLKAAMDQWYETEMTLQGGPGKQSHGWWPWGLRVFDFDRDGALDIIATHHGTPRSIILRSQFKQNGQLQFTNVTAELGIESRDLPGADDRPWIWDFDGDGWLDIAGFSDETLAACAWNSGGKKFTATAKTLFAPVSHPKEVLDLNGDGYLDLDGGSKGQWLYDPASRTYRKDPAPRFALPEGVPPALEQSLDTIKKSTRFMTIEYWTHAHRGYDTFGYEPRPIDLDGDGRGDVVVHGSGGYGAPYLGRYLFRAADGTLVDKTKECGLPESGAPIMVEDLTGDGAPEILVGGAKDSGLYLNDGKGKFSRVPGKLTDALIRRGAYILRAFPADFDNDGRTDLVITLPREGAAHVFQNAGGGEFKAVLAKGGCWDSNPVAIADIDNDGRLDLVIGGSTDADSKKDIAIYRNATNTKDAGHFLKIAPRMPSPNPYAVGAVIEVFRAGELEKTNAGAKSQPYFVEKAHPDSTPVHVGLGEAKACDVRITFPGGKVVTASGIAGDRTVTVDRETGKVSVSQ